MSGPLRTTAPSYWEIPSFFLKYLLADKASVGRLARWSLKLQEFDMKVKYRRGSTLGAADLMSRIRENPDGSFMVGAVQPGLVEGEEPLEVTRARVSVILEGSKPEGDPRPSSALGTLSWPKLAARG